MNHRQKARHQNYPVFLQTKPSARIVQYRISPILGRDEAQTNQGTGIKKTDKLLTRCAFLCFSLSVLAFASFLGLRLCSGTRAGLRRPCAIFASSPLSPSRLVASSYTQCGYINRSYIAQVISSSFVLLSIRIFAPPLRCVCLSSPPLLSRYGPIPRNK